MCSVSRPFSVSERSDAGDYKCEETGSTILYLKPHPLFVSLFIV